MLEHPAPLPLCLNVNIPAGAPETIRGIRVCRQAQGLWREQFVCRQDPHGRDYLWLTGEFVNDEHGAEETDEWALTHGYVSVQPVQADQTDYRRMEEMRRLLRPIAGERRTVPRRRTAHEGGNTPVEYNV